MLGHQRRLYHPGHSCGGFFLFSPSRAPPFLFRFALKGPCSPPTSPFPPPSQAGASRVRQASVRFPHEPRHPVLDLVKPLLLLQGAFLPLPLLLVVLANTTRSSPGWDTQSFSCPPRHPLRPKQNVLGGAVVLYAHGNAREAEPPLTYVLPRGRFREYVGSGTQRRKRRWRIMTDRRQTVPGQARVAGRVPGGRCFWQASKPVIYIRLFVSTFLCSRLPRPWAREYLLPQRLMTAHYAPSLADRRNKQNTIAESITCRPPRMDIGCREDPAPVCMIAHASSMFGCKETSKSGSTQGAEPRKDVQTPNKWDGNTNTHAHAHIHKHPSTIMRVAGVSGSRLIDTDRGRIRRRSAGRIHRRGRLLAHVRAAGRI